MDLDTIKYIRIDNEEHTIDASYLNGVHADGIQSMGNLVTSVSSSSTSSQYPSAACLYRIVGDLSEFDESVESEPTVYYTLTLSVSPGGYGNITITGGDSGPYLPGTSVEITATANAGYVFKKWYQDDSTDATRTVVMNSDVTLTAIFEIYVNEDESIDLDYPDIEDLWDL